jgi:hypothetical protein
MFEAAYSMLVFHFSGMLLLCIVCQCAAGCSVLDILKRAYSIAGLVESMDHKATTLVWVDRSD